MKKRPSAERKAILGTVISNQSVHSLCHNQKFIHGYLDETVTMWTDSETAIVFLQYLLLVIAASCENCTESDNLFVNERNSE